MNGWGSRLGDQKAQKHKGDPKNSINLSEKSFMGESGGGRAGWAPTQFLRRSQRAEPPEEGSGGNLTPRPDSAVKENYEPTARAKIVQI